MFFIEKGIARAYYLYDGNDVTDYFATEYQFIGAVESLFTGLPSAKGIQVLEDCMLNVLPYAEFERLCTIHHDIERAGRKVAIYGMLDEQRRIESVRFHDAKKRYTDLNAKYPGLTNRCPLKHIASYLGISQVSLSRLRAEV
jgi:CRP-like cAMP-binding protein